MLRLVLEHVLLEYTRQKSAWCFDGVTLFLTSSSVRVMRLRNPTALALSKEVFHVRVQRFWSLVTGEYKLESNGLLAEPE